MDIYELIRKLNFSPRTEQRQMQLEGGGSGDVTDYKTWDLSGETGWDDLGPFRSKYNEVSELGDGLLGVKFQNPNKTHKYDTLFGTYKLDPATGQYVMQGDPTEYRETSSRDQVQDFIEKGGLMTAAVLGGGYGLQGLTGAGAGGLTGVDAAMADMAASGAAGMGGGGAAAGGAASSGLLGSLPTGSAAGIGQMTAPTLGSLATVPNITAGGAGFFESLLGAGNVTKALDKVPWKNIIGAGLGAYTSQDQEQKSTSEREPWGPAQGWIKDNMTVGRGLQQQYMDQPFSPAQQQAYQGLFNTINAGNQLAPGLLSNANAMMQGYDRHADKTTRARPKLNPLTASWAPGLLNFGG